MENEEANGLLEDPITPTMEDYMEAIFRLGEEKRNVRVKDIAKRLGVKMPTVTSMLKTLSKRGLIDYEKYEYLELTDKGSDIGREIHRRHHVLRNFLTDILMIDFKKADAEACKMEHAISPSTLDSIIDFMEFIQMCPRAGSNFLDYFHEYRMCGKERDKCIERMKEFANGFKGQIKTMEEIDEKEDGAR